MDLWLASAKLSVSGESLADSAHFVVGSRWPWKRSWPPLRTWTFSCAASLSQHSWRSSSASSYCTSMKMSTSWTPSPAGSTPLSGWGELPFHFVLQLLFSVYSSRDNSMTFFPIRCPFVREVALCHPPPLPIFSICPCWCFLLWNWQHELLKEQDSENMKI